METQDWFSKFQGKTLCWSDYVIDVGESTWCIINNAIICESCGCLCSQHEITRSYARETTRVQKSTWDNDFIAQQKKYEDAKHTLSTSERILKRLEEESMENVEVIENQLKLLQTLRKELQKIALRPQLTTVGNYIDELIDLENTSEHRDPKKMNVLRDLKKQENAIAKLQKIAK
eukprot:92296_1